MSEPEAPQTRLTPQIGWGAVAAIAAAIVLAVFLLNRGRGAEPGDFAVIAIEETRGQTSNSFAGATITIEGPLAVSVSEDIDLVAAGPPGTVFVWTMPDNTQVRDQAEITVRAPDPGLAVVELSGELINGETVDLDYTIVAWP